jgi:hypothetical protein
MASSTEIEKQIEEIKIIIDEISNVDTAGQNKYIYNGKTYSRTQLEQLAKPYKTQLAKLTKLYGPYGSAMAELRRAEEIAANPITESPTGMSQANATKNVEDAKAKVEKEKSNLLNVDITKGKIVTKPAASAADFRKVEGFEPGKPGDSATGGKNGGGGAGGAGVGTGVGAGAGKVPSKPKTKSNWEAKFREMFPGESWMLDIDRTKYADVFKLFQTSIDGEVYKTPEGLARFKAQLEGTSFVKELATTDMVRQVKNVVGDLGFDSMPFNSFLTKAMNLGWKDATLKQEVYKEAFRKDDAGNFVNPTAINRAKASNDYLGIAKIGKSYFSTVSDDTIQNVLTGGMAQEDVQRQQRELAKTKYGHLANLIDQGFSLEDLSSSFKTQAAQLLEKDPNSIDMSQADYEQAFNFGEEGKKRMMSTGEWEIKLRSDPRFNWDKTENAKSEARSLANSITQAFGRVI